LETRTYRVEGLSCVDCAGRIQAAVERLEGVEACDVDVGTGKLTFQVAAPTFDIDPVAKIVTESGHVLVTSAETPRRTEGSFLRFLLASRATAMTVVAGLLTVAGLAMVALDVPTLARVIPFALAILIGGQPVVRHAYQEIAMAHSLGINSLMVIAVVGAALIGEWAEAAIVVVLFSLGEALEGYAAEKARGALDALLDLAPSTALLVQPDGNLEEVAVETLAVGDRVLVRAGDRVSVDGVIRRGESALDQATITGESVPVDKGPGDEVFAGTINTSGSLEVEVIHLAEASTLSRMIELVQEAQSEQAPLQRFVDRFARIYTPAVTAFAVLIATIPPLLFGQMFLGNSGWLMRALQMLVIACPCALVISTPVSVVSALTQAASQGVLIKGGRTLEALGHVSVMAFDKTGTLTEGQPVTTDVLEVCRDTSHPHRGLAYAAALESQSSHPLARALMAEAVTQHVATLPSEDVSVMAGLGVRGRVGGRDVTVASHPYFDAHLPHAEAVCRDAQRLAEEGKTVMLVCHDGEVCSVFAVADTLRQESRDVIRALHVMGVRAIMLTGDSPTVAKAIGREVGIAEVRAGLLPEDKVTAVRALRDDGHIVAMVGDGVNDAPALAQASVGIAMGGAGSDQAMETADVVLMGDDLRQLPVVVGLSRRTDRTIRANVAFALGIKALVFALAVAGIATLWMAIVADVGASVAVILNGMRLRHDRSRVV
jgi:Zn2+/Cd2+-exporting ATPase